MNGLFLQIVKMSLSATWLILAVLILRLVFKKAPKWINVLLWGIVAIRLICPLSIESPVSLIPDFAGSDKLVSEWTDDYIEDVSIIHDNSLDYDAAVTAGREPISDGSGGYYVITKYDQLDEPSTVKNTVVPVLSFIWASGVVILLMYTAISYLNLRRKLDTAVLYRDNIFQSEHVSSPFVMGIIKPRIYLPFKLDGQNMEYVVAHEIMHIRYKDYWWKLIGFLIFMIHWFNPLVLLAYVLLCRDIELACDERVIKELNNEQRADYTEALVNCSVNHRVVSTYHPLAFGELGVKERVKSVMNYKKPAFWIIILAVVACVVVAACFLTNPPAKEAAPPDMKADSSDSPAKEDDSSFPPGTQSKVFQARILDIYDELFLVEPVQGSSELNSADQIEIPMKNMDPSREPLVGDLIEISYSGEILETYPARLNDVFNIKAIDETNKLSLNDVITLSQYGYDLTWSDFEQYAYTETGSGLYIRVYEIDEHFSLWIGGGQPDNDPMYIYLALTDDSDTRIDIRDGGVTGVTEFISEHTSASIKSVEEIDYGKNNNIKPNTIMDDGITKESKNDVENEQVTAVYVDGSGQESSTNQEEILHRIESFIEQLKISEFKRTPEESGYECVYDGSVIFKEHTIYFNQSGFTEDKFIHFVLVINEDGRFETLYDVDVSSQLAGEFNEIVNFFTDRNK